MSAERRRFALLLAGILLVALNLRVAITSVGPLADDLRRDLGLSSTAAGLLTTAPLLALGLVAPIAPLLAGRFGAERVVLGSLVAITGGIALRLPATVGVLFTGTVVAGCGIAVGNVLMPGIVKQRFGAGAPAMMGVYSAALSAGAALATGVTVPIEHAAHGSWRLALAAWGIPAVLAAIVWLPQTRVRSAGAVVVRPIRISLWRDPLAWRVTVLMGLQSLLFYVVAAWLPDIFHAHGIGTGTAGLLVSIGMVIGIPASILLSYLASRRADQRAVLALAIGMTTAGLLGVLVAPGALAVVWIVLLGFGQGGVFALAMTIVVLRSPDADHAAALSGMSQSVGYTLAALGPLLIGALHDASGGWTLPLAVALALVVPESIAAFGAGKPGLVGEAGRARGARTQAPLPPVPDAPARS
jgi:MFS transporter, CP family, cyanate transporter